MDTRKWVLIVLLSLIVLFLYRVRMVLSPFLFAAVIAYTAYPLVQIFERRQVPRPIAIILVYLLFAVIIGLSVSFLIPQLAEEVDELIKTIPDQTEMLADGLGIWRSLDKISVPEVLQASFDLIVGRIQQLVEGVAQRIAGILVGIVSQIISLLIAPILAFYLLRDLEAIKRRSFMLIPKRYRLTVFKFCKEINRVVDGFIRGQLVNALLVGSLIAAGLALLGIKYAVFIGLLAGVFNIIPYFGPVIGFVPASLFALAKSPLSVLWVLILFVVVNQLEANVISPKIIGERVGLHPLAVIFAIFAGGELMGIIGMLVAVPAAAVVRIAFLYVLKRVEEA
ncbi:MAG: AI-2E family transporter [Limnochordia bacterium]|jgi:predicted PurR-regulated permease PerM|nr:AI-2E family transporter [Bacillota bacterium]HOB08700.1 AI-2E family transporter [Limnochordia bacterium]NLH32014.1 AI-2E family transporter [Bacillota bacterium]HPT92691.1 AI-2E family transporter [Limnochordia bacterium]HPZ30940.1 AI-2E family transporter [Limnochordia bacterium]